MLEECVHVVQHSVYTFVSTIKRIEKRPLTLAYCTFLAPFLVRVLVCHTLPVASGQWSWNLAFNSFLTIRLSFISSPVMVSSPSIATRNISESVVLFPNFEFIPVHCCCHCCCHSKHYETHDWENFPVPELVQHIFLFGPTGKKKTVPLGFFWSNQEFHNQEQTRRKQGENREKQPAFCPPFPVKKFLV